jgi:hypothetical protein
VTTRRADTPARYELRVAGHLDERWAGWFAGLVLTHEDDGTTALRGPVVDQAELHGHLARVRDLGATLVAVTAITAVDGQGPDSGGADRARRQQDPRTACTEQPNPTDQE